MADLLESSVGPLHDLEGTMTDAETYAWSGTDEGGRLIAGKVASPSRRRPRLLRFAIDGRRR
jgi:hypothetical protein